MQGQHFPVDHDIDRRIQVELDPPRALALGQRVLDMRTVIKTGQIADQTGGAVSGAKVTVTEVGTGIRLNAVWDCAWA